MNPWSSPTLEFPQPRFLNLAESVGSLSRSALASPWLLLACKLIIGIVSAYDIFLTVKYVESLPHMELNPVGRWLMHLDSGPECALDQIACFITAKFAGNFMTLATIELICHWKRHIGISVAVAVALLQLILFCFLISC